MRVRSNEDDAIFYLKLYAAWTLGWQRGAGNAPSMRLAQPVLQRRPGNAQRLRSRDLRPVTGICLYRLL
jgi:hypothetical protein